MYLSLNSINIFNNLFSGNTDYYGYSTLTGEIKESNGKVMTDSYTKEGLVTDTIVRKHLEGVAGLGIIPITTDHKCSFSAIDIDMYKNPYKLQTIVTTIYKYGFPFVPCLTKSGGLHLYTFFSRPVLAKSARSLLKKYLTVLALPNSTEIFPKQDRSTGQGNFINLPYFNYAETKRAMVKGDMQLASFEEFIFKAESSAKTIDEIEEHLKGLPLSDAPPCIQSIYLLGSTSNRNNYLFSVGRYYKSKHGEDFETYVIKANSLLDDPQTEHEVNNTVISSLRKKDYSYMCKEPPLCDRCNRAECNTREYGLQGSNISKLSYGQLIRTRSDPPTYIWEVENQELFFESEEALINQAKFRQLCIRHLHVLPNKVKQDTWDAIVNQALRNMKTEDENSSFTGMSPGEILKEHVVEYCRGRSSNATANTKAQIMHERVYKDVEGKMYVFRSKDLLKFLRDKCNFRSFSDVEIQHRVRNMGAIYKRYYIDKNNTGVRVCCISFEEINKIVPHVERPSLDFLEVDLYENEKC
jgi:hypothetical protein